MKPSLPGRKKRPLFEDGWWICFSILPLHSFPKFRNKKTLWATFSPAQKEKQRARRATRTNRGLEFEGPALYSCMGNGACRFGVAFGLGLGFNLSASNAMTFLACSRKALQRQWSIILMIETFTHAIRQILWQNVNRHSGSTYLIIDDHRYVMIWYVTQPIQHLMVWSVKLFSPTALKRWFTPAEPSDCTARSKLLKSVTVIFPNLSGKVAVSHGNLHPGWRTQVVGTQSLGFFFDNLRYLLVFCLKDLMISHDHAEKSPTETLRATMTWHPPSQRLIECILP